MSDDDYLWDGSDPPDAEVERLEALLGELRYDQPLPELPARPRASGRWTTWTLAAAAAALLAAGLSGWLREPDDGPQAWTVSRLEGSPRIEGRDMGDGGLLKIGQWLTTDPGSRAEVAVARIGRVVVEPGSRLGLVRSARDEHRLKLERGALEAQVLAPPRLFVVDTPSASAVDLGCHYTLEVDAAGVTHLSVLTGFVSLEDARHASWVPAGATCATRPGLGPGLPVFADASPALAAAVRDLADGADGALESLLAAARPRDTLTLWHALSRVEAAERGRVFDRIAALVPPPHGVTREKVVALDPTVVRFWRQELRRSW